MTEEGKIAFRCLPRMRGDRPWLRSFLPHSPMFTPHARGSTLLAHRPPRGTSVYPACAGIDLSSAMMSPRWASLPRMRGDRPDRTVVLRSLHLFTPHARGSTLSAFISKTLIPVYPACAGIDRGDQSDTSKISCLPRMRGDRPTELGLTS